MPGGERVCGSVPDWEAVRDSSSSAKIQDSISSLCWLALVQSPVMSVSLGLFDRMEDSSYTMQYN